MKLGKQFVKAQNLRASVYHSLGLPFDERKLNWEERRDYFPEYMPTDDAMPLPEMA